MTYLKVRGCERRGDPADGGGADVSQLYGFFWKEQKEIVPVICNQVNPLQCTVFKKKITIFTLIVISKSTEATLE